MPVKQDQTKQDQISQDQIFATSEGDQWFQRNQTALEKFDPANDFPLRLLQLYNLCPQRKGFGYGINGAMAGYVRVSERCNTSGSNCAVKCRRRGGCDTIRKPRSCARCRTTSSKTSTM